MAHARTYITGCFLKCHTRRSDLLASVRRWRFSLGTSQHGKTSDKMSNAKLEAMDTGLDVFLTETVCRPLAYLKNFSKLSTQPTERNAAWSTRNSGSAGSLRRVTLKRAAGQPVSEEQNSERSPSLSCLAPPILPCATVCFSVSGR